MCSANLFKILLKDKEQLEVHMVLLSLMSLGTEATIWTLKTTLGGLYYWMWPSVDPQREMLIELKTVLENQERLKKQNEELTAKLEKVEKEFEHIEDESENN